MEMIPLICPHCSNQDKTLLSWSANLKGINYYWCLVCSREFEIKDEHPRGTTVGDTR